MLFFRRLFCWGSLLGRLVLYRFGVGFSSGSAIVFCCGCFFFFFWDYGCWEISIVSFVLIFFCIKNNFGKVLEPLISRKKRRMGASFFVFWRLGLFKKWSFFISFVTLWAKKSNRKMSSFFLQNQWVISWKQRFSRLQNALKNNSQGVSLVIALLVKIARFEGLFHFVIFCFNNH